MDGSVGNRLEGLLGGWGVPGACGVPTGSVADTAMPAAALGVGSMGEAGTGKSCSCEGAFC